VPNDTPQERSRNLACNPPAEVWAEFLRRAPRQGTRKLFLRNAVDNQARELVKFLVSLEGLPTQDAKDAAFHNAYGKLENVGTERQLNGGLLKVQHDAIDQLVNQIQDLRLPNEMAKRARVFLFLIAAELGLAGDV
jgi:hypothetical protein